jgi:hypothetical protein
VNNESERMWKEVVIISFEVLSCYFPGEAEESHEKQRSGERKGGLLPNIRIASGICAVRYISMFSGLLFPGGT